MAPAKPRRPNAPAGPQQSAVDAALLAKMGIDPADLLAGPAGPPEGPTFADYIPRVSRAVGAGTRRVYGTYWNRVADA